MALIAMKDVTIAFEGMVAVDRRELELLDRAQLETLAGPVLRS